MKQSYYLFVILICFQEHSLSVILARIYLHRQLTFNFDDQWKSDKIFKYLFYHIAIFITNSRWVFLSKKSIIKKNIEIKNKGS